MKNKKEYINGMRAMKAYIKQSDCLFGENPILFHIKFIQMSPAINILEKAIRLRHIIKDCSFLEEISKSGLKVTATSFFFEISNYKMLLETIFGQEYKIIDCQKKYAPGHPDFKLEPKNSNKNEIYIEIKKNGDGIRGSQMKWITDNKDKELYFLFLTENKNNT